MCLHRPGGKYGGQAGRDSNAMSSSSAASPTAVSTSYSSSDSDSTPTAAAPAYPSDASTGMVSTAQTGRVATPAPPPPSAPRQAHAEYQKLLQQRHRERQDLHKNQVGRCSANTASQVTGSCFKVASFLIAILAALLLLALV